MTENTREQRLATDLISLQALKKGSTLFDFESTGDPPDRYTIIFRGKGISGDSSSASDIKTVELHRCDIRLPYSYPRRPPDLRWLTPILHPNISFSGFIKLRDIGLPWEQALGLDVVCERLWDVARLAYLNLDSASNYSAKNWFEDECKLSLPLDRRPLRDKQLPSNANVIRYGRRGESSSSNKLSPTKGQTAGDSDIFFIGEDTPTPQLPPQILPSRRRIAPKRRTGGEDDILYIGDE